MTPAADPVRCRLIVIAKRPVPGRVKTRLMPRFSAEQAAELAAAALADTLAAVFAAVPLARRRGLPIEPVLALDGEPGDWLDVLLEGGRRPRVVKQVDGGLDRRLAAAFTDATAGLADPTALLIGMDTPQVTPRLLVDAVATLVGGGTDAVLGRADDGGWWAMGLRRPDPALLEGVPMSTERTGLAQYTRLREAGLTVSALPTLTDVDTAADAYRVAGQAERGQFAAALARMTDGRPADLPQQ